MGLRLKWTVMLLGFVGLNIWTIVTGGWSGLHSYLGNLGPYGILATVDLLIALFIGVWWMWGDARRRDVSPWPYVLLTLLTGSVGLLAYLTLHAGRRMRSLERRPDGSISIKMSRQLAAPAMEVWSVVADFQRVNRFHPYVQTVDVLSTEACGVGARRRCNLRRMPSVEEEVVEWQEGRGYRIKGSTPFDFIGEVGGGLWVEPSGGGSIASFELTFKPRLGAVGRAFGLFWLETLAERMGPHILAGLEHYVRTGDKLSLRELASPHFGPAHRYSVAANAPSEKSVPTNT
jgi:hypothetical protein